jgi:hypothetical protein
MQNNITIELMSNKKTKLSLEIHGKIISVEFDHIDVDLDDYFQALKTLVIGATFTETQFEHWIIDEAEVIGEFLHNQK